MNIKFYLFCLNLHNIFGIHSELLSKAISIAIQEACSKKTITADIRILSNNGEIDSFLKNLSNIAANIESGFNLNQNKEKKKCNIFIIDKLNDFKEFQKFISPQFFDFRGNFLILFIDGTLEEIQEIFEVMWNFQILNVNAMFKSAMDVLSIVTFLPFKNHKCNDTTPVVISEYINATFSRRDFFIEKLSNLQQCPIKIVIATKSEPYIFIKDNDTFHGRDINLIEELAKSLNFKINYIVMDDKGFLLDNGTAGGIFKLLQNGSADMTICDMWVTQNRAKYFDATTPYFNDDIIFVMPPRSELTSVEKLIYPLDRETWIFLIICFAVGYLVIFIVSFQSKSVKDFVFGEHEKYPYLNMFNTFLGGNQSRLPTRNFARFILLVFLGFSLVIRTAYQGAMYQFMQSDKKYKEPQTIAELIELNYRFHVLSVSMELFEHFTALQKRFANFV